jgi:hypothetical protein
MILGCAFKIEYLMMTKVNMLAETGIYTCFLH